MGRAPKFSPREKAMIRERLTELEGLRELEGNEFPGFYDHEINCLRQTLKSDEEEM